MFLLDVTVLFSTNLHFCTHYYSLTLIRYICDDKALFTTNSQYWKKVDLWTHNVPVNSKYSNAAINAQAKVPKSLIYHISFDDQKNIGIGARMVDDGELTVTDLH